MAEKVKITEYKITTQEELINMKKGKNLNKLSAYFDSEGVGHFEYEENILDTGITYSSSDEEEEYKITTQEELINMKKDKNLKKLSGYFDSGGVGHFVYGEEEKIKPDPKPKPKKRKKGFRF